MEHWSDALPENACRDAVAWAREQRTAKSAWRDCQRGDWMLWLVGKLSGEPESAARKKLVLCACECARLALPYVKAGETRPLIAIETAEKWARGDANITTKDVRKSAYAAAYADSAAHAAALAAAHAAALAAALAADLAADSAAHAAALAAAHAADSAADSAADAAYAADAAKARSKTLAHCADIVRKHYPKAPRLI